MRKITLLLLFLLASVATGYSQCFQPTQYPGATVVSNNMGFTQEISTCNYTLEYSHISNIVIGSDYVFTCTYEGSTEKYITVTDMDDNVIAMGDSPLSVNAISADEIKVHYTDDASCAGINDCHVTTLQIILTCPVPLNASVSNVTTTSADFMWDAGGVELAWEVLILPEGSPFPGSSTSGTAVATTSYSATSLMQSEGYDFYVRANCGSEFSPWTLPLNFNMACDAIGNFNENFDAAVLYELPTCWNALLRGDVSQYAHVYNVDYGNVHSDPNSVELYNSDSFGDYDVMLVSPNLSNLGAGTHRMKFYARGFGNLQVGTLDGFSDTAVFTPLEEVSITEDSTQYTIDFTSYSGTDTYIGIRLNTTNTYTSAFVDDILWEQSPTCPDVTEIGVPAIGTDTATVSWVAGGTETAWEVAVGAASVNDPNTLTALSATAQSKDLTGLTDNTDYKVWVRSMCAGGTDPGVWIGPVAFTTACLPIANFYEDFDSVDLPELPGCWTGIRRGPTVSQYSSIRTSDFTAVHSAPNFVEMYNSDSDTAGSDDIILVSPNLSNVGSGTHRLKFYAKNSGSLQVGTMDLNTNDGVFSVMEEVSTSNDATQYTIDFSSYSGTDTYVAIRLNNSDMYTSVLIDDVLWEVNPTCPDVTEVAVPLTTTDGATVTWISGGTETSWNIAVGPPSTTDPNTLTFVTSNVETTDLTGLTDNTDYKVWVRSACAGNDNGAWIGPVPFTTACLPTVNFNENFDTTNVEELPGCWTGILRGPTVSEYANVGVIDWEAVHSAPNAVQLYNSDSNTAGADDIMLVSPNLSTLSLGTYRLKFYAKNNGSLQIGTLDSNTDSATFSMIEEVTTSSDALEYKIDFSSYSGPDTYVAIRLNNSEMYTSVLIDNVVWEIAPTCPDVTDVVIDGTTTTTADISWVANGPETQWDVVYTLASETDPTTGTPVSSSNQYATISGLANATSYNVWVRSVCTGGTDLGAWIGPLEFRTLCVPGDLPFTEDFESATPPGLPICGNVINLGAGDHQWFVDDAPGNGFNSNTLRYSYDFSNAADTWFFTRGVNLAANTDYVISFRYGDNGDDNYSEDLKVMAGTENTFEGMTVDIADYTGINGDTPNMAEVTFSVPTAGVYYFGFNAYSGANEYYLYVDDISVDMPLGTPSTEVQNFSYYPNPVKNVLTLTNTKNITSVEVYNMIGQRLIVKDENSTTSKVDMSALPSGNYVVKVTADGMTKTVKVLKQ